MFSLKCLVNLFVIGTLCDCSRILGVFPLPWGSHYILGLKLMKGLAEAGHDITFVTPFPTKDPPKNSTWIDIVLDGFQDQFNAMISKDDKLNHRKSTSSISSLKGYTDWNINICKITLTHLKTKTLLESGSSFDLLLISQGFGNDCFLVFSHVFKAPTIIVSSLGATYTSNRKVANPEPVATSCNIFKYFPELEEGAGFLDRLQNLLYILLLNGLFKYQMLAAQQPVVSELYPDIPDLDSLGNNVSLIFLNSHPSFSQSIPLVPSMVEIGGYHVDEPRQLPNDLQDFLDNATEGAIFFSLGSAVKSQDMPVAKRDIFLEVFRNLKYKILWKFETSLPNKPDNVLIKSWMPQQDILAHPNLKLFITHGGMLSSIEAVYNGVPVLCLPMFLDQEKNSITAVRRGYALKLDYLDENFNNKQLQDAIKALLQNPEYTNNANKLSKIFHDRPMTAMQTAVYWCEYVIREKGAYHLRVKGMELPLYKYYMIDVLMIVLSVPLIFIFGLKCLYNCVVCRLMGSYRSKVKSKES